MIEKSADTGTLIVDGQGAVHVAPDIARVSVSVIAEAKSASDAVTQNAAQADAVIAKLRAIGIGSDAIRTTGLSLSPMFSNDGATLVRYRAENTVEIEANVSDAGKVFDAAASSGASRAGSLSFALRDDSKLRPQALDAAVAAARRDADRVAAAAGLTVTGVETIEVLSSGGPVMFSAAVRSATSVLPGSLTVSASVRVTYRVEPAGAAAPAPDLTFAQSLVANIQGIQTRLNSERGRISIVGRSLTDDEKGRLDRIGRAMNELDSAMKLVGDL